MLIAIPPKYAVSPVIGFIKRKSAIHVARVYGEHRRHFTGVVTLLGCLLADSPFKLPCATSSGLSDVADGGALP